jgi:hypothetical protein
MKQLRMFSTPALSLREFVREKLRDLQFRQRAREERRLRRRLRKGAGIAGGGDLARLRCYSRWN